MFEEIYNIFKLELDGEEFDTDDDALLAANVEFRNVLDDRDWKFLMKTTTLTAGTLSLASITDLDKVTNIYVANRDEPLYKASFDQRFDPNYDYYIDVVNNSIVLIENTYLSTPLVVEYKYAPVDLTDSNTPINQRRLIPIIAYRMGLTYYRKDQDTSIYTQLQDKLEDSMNKLIAYNESL